GPAGATIGHELVFWDLARQRLLARWPLNQNNLGVNFSCEGTRLGLLTPRGPGVQLRVLAWPEYTELAQVEVPGTPRCFTLSPDARTAYIGNQGSLVSVDLTAAAGTFTPFPIQSRQQQVDPLDLACSPDARWLAVYWRHGELVLYDRRMHRAGATVSIPGPSG